MSSPEIFGHRFVNATFRYFTVRCDASVLLLRGSTGNTADVRHSPVLLPMIVFAPGFHEWWISRYGGQNLVNCSVCAEIYSVLEVPESLRATMTLRRGAQLLLLKVRFGLKDPLNILQHKYLILFRFEYLIIII